ncbi:MAG: CARDB domain-containing protein [Bacillota bacterium]
MKRFLPIILVLASLPLSASAAFNYQYVTNTYGYMSRQQPILTRGGIYDSYGTTIYNTSPANYKQICLDNSAGVSDTSTKSCSVVKFTSEPWSGPCGCAIATQLCGGPGSTCGPTYNSGYVRIFDNPVSAYSIAESQAQWNAFVTALGNGTATSTPDMDANYDVCNISYGTSDQYHFDAGISKSSNQGCMVYQHTVNGPQPPTASLAAYPTTINAGDASGLSYQCTNSTSASIDNGVGSVPPPSGWLQVTPATSTTYTLTCTGSDGTDTATATVTVTGTSALPNLTAGAVTPVSATMGTPVTLTASINNTSATTTGTGFTNLFQRATDANGTNASDIGTSAFSSALLGGSSKNATLSYTFPTSGTWYVRVCADKNAAGNNGVISESSETDNCGSWTAITVADSAATLSCTPNKTSIQSGQSITWSASPTNLGTYTWSPSEGGSISGGASYTRTYNTAGAYGMNVTAGGKTAVCSASGNPTVTVTGGNSCTNPTVSIAASPDRVEGDGTHTVTLTVTGSGVSASCLVTGPNGLSTTLSANSCNVAGTVISKPITAQSVFTVTCGTATDSVIVNILPAYKEF